MNKFLKAKEGTLMNSLAGITAYSKFFPKSIDQNSIITQDISNYVLEQVIELRSMVYDETIDKIFERISNQPKCKIYRLY